jgi:hypothetical protein
MNRFGRLPIVTQVDSLSMVVLTSSRFSRSCCRSCRCCKHSTKRQWYMVKVVSNSLSKGS